ncbi:MAG: immunoglobulin domain-containing protein [Verrucomicrobia bacterium]|nr:immunoglobulin domain-containing protein [Verrucomicrobiota bacterium]
MKIGSSPCPAFSHLLRILLLLILAAGNSGLMAQPISAHVEPVATNAVLGTSVTFCAVAQGSGTFNYQWQKNGLNLPGATNQCLSVTNIAIADGGSYRATITGGLNALQSAEGLLLVSLDSLPGTDLFDAGTFITVASNSVSGASFSATRELYEPFHLGLSTSNSVWYRWRTPVSGIVTFDTQGSTFDTVMAVYGGGLQRLTEVASDDDSGGFHTSRLTWNAQAGVDYNIVIDGVTGETGHYVCNWNLQPTGVRVPVITLKPSSRTAPPGGTVTFTAAATDPRGILLFQWFHNEQPIPGATSSNLTIVNVTAAHLGQYRLAVTNSVGLSAISPPADLEIGPIASVQSKDKIAQVPTANGGSRFAAGGTSAGTFSLAAGTIINHRFFNAGTTDRCEPAHCGVPGGASRWFQLAALADGICTIDTEGSDIDTILAVYLQNFSICTNLYEPLVDCNNDVIGSCEQILGLQGTRERGSRLSFFATAGTIYRAVVDTVGGVRGTNVQFNVHFTTTASAPATTAQIDSETNCLLQLRGSSVSLQVATGFASPSNTYQWFVNGRKIAGATRDGLLLPFLNYSDAGRYSVNIQKGSAGTLLPGASILVLDPCRGEGEGGSSNRIFRLIGAATESIQLQSSASLNTTSAWQSITPIRASIEPLVWDVSTGSFRFYRALRLPP